MRGAGYAWLISNAMYFVFWVPVVHRRFASGLHRLWLLNDVAAIVILTGGCTLLVHHLVRWPTGRMPMLVLIALLSGMLVTIAAAGSSWVRQKIVRARS
jgi:hypothetical protein